MAITVQARESHVEVRNGRRGAQFRLDPQEALELARLLDEFVPAAQAGGDAWLRLRETNPQPLQRGAVRVALAEAAVRLDRSGDTGLSVDVADLKALNGGLVAAAHRVLGPRLESVWLREDLGAFLATWRPRVNPQAREPVQKITLAMDLLLARLRRQSTADDAPPAIVLDPGLIDLCSRLRREREGGAPLRFRSNAEIDARFERFITLTGEDNLDLAINSALLWAQTLEHKQENLARWERAFF